MGIWYRRLCGFYIGKENGVSFQVERKSMNGLEVVEIKNLQTGEYVNIIPGYGGAINEVVLKKGSDLHSMSMRLSPTML